MPPHGAYPFSVVSVYARTARRVYPAREGASRPLAVRGGGRRASGRRRRDGLSESERTAMRSRQQCKQTCCVCAIRRCVFSKMKGTPPHGAYPFSVVSVYARTVRRVYPAREGASRPLAVRGGGRRASGRRRRDGLSESEGAAMRSRQQCKQTCCVCAIRRCVFSKMKGTGVCPFPVVEAAAQAARKNKKRPNSFLPLAACRNAA